MGCTIGGSNQDKTRKHKQQSLVRVHVEEGFLLYPCNVLLSVDVSGWHCASEVDAAHGLQWQPKRQAAMTHEHSSSKANTGHPEQASQRGAILCNQLTAPKRRRVQLDVQYYFESLLEACSQHTEQKQIMKEKAHRQICYTFAIILVIWENARLGYGSFHWLGLVGATGTKLYLGLGLFGRVGGIIRRRWNSITLVM